MYLVSAHDLTIDSKNRLVIPSQFRMELASAQDNRALFAMPGYEKGIVEVYPELTFRRLQSSSPPPKMLSAKAKAFRRFRELLTTLLLLDEQGRVLLPERLLKRVGLTKEVTLAGRGDHLELCNRQSVEEFQDHVWSEYSDLAEAYEKESAEWEERQQCRPTATHNEHETERT